MSKNRRERNTQIPEHAIETAAGENDKVVVCWYDYSNMCEKSVQITTKGNTKTRARGDGTREVTSSDLGINSMEIPVQAGGIETVKKDKSKEGQER